MQRSPRSADLLELLMGLGVIALVVLIGSFLRMRADLTNEGRFTLRPATTEMLDSLKDVMYVKVYLTGALPADLQRLSSATKDLLDEMHAVQPGKIQYTFIDPSESDDEKTRKFGPDAVLTARHNGGTKDQYGKLILGIYDSRLADVKTGEIVWRASSTVSRGGITIELAERGDAFAVELSNKLKQDQIFRTCPIIELKK